MPIHQHRSSQPARRRARCALAVALLFTGAAHADDGGFSYRFSGFGTLGVAHSSEKNADFTSASDQPNGAGYTHAWAFNTDSRLAGQAELKFGDRFSATGQVMVQQRYDDSYTPTLMMAFGKWQATPEVALRAGRMPLPVFLISDSRTVGYSQAQLRPPVDMYKVFATYFYDGADVTWGSHVGDIALKSQLYAGKARTHVPGGGVTDLTPLFGANLTADTGDLTLRASVVHVKLAVSVPILNTLFQGIRFGFPANSLGPGSPAIEGSATLADQYEVANKRGSTFVSFGLNYDPGTWFVTAELGQIAKGGLIPRITQGYVSGGMRFGNFTPYSTLSRTQSTLSGENTGNPVLDAIIKGQASSQTGVSLGLRWDVMKNVDIKTQFDHVKPDSGSLGLMTANMQPTFQPGKAYNVFSAAVDFVF